MRIIEKLLPRTAQYDVTFIEHVASMRYTQGINDVLLHDLHGSSQLQDLVDDYETCETSRGDKPGEGLSDISGLGSALRPRAIATICCSPP